jgi:hypothetical protein
MPLMQNSIIYDIIDTYADIKVIYSFSINFRKRRERDIISAGKLSW